MEMLITKNFVTVTKQITKSLITQFPMRVQEHLQHSDYFPQISLLYPRDIWCFE